MTDLDQERVDKGVGYVHGEVDKLLGKGRVGPDKANRLKALVTGATTKDHFADADFVIEAVFEEMSVKKQVWAEVEAIVGPDCVLATNTSSLSITEMAADLRNPERVVGFHFFNPVAIMPLLEIIKGERTDDATLATAFATGKALRKTTILVKDSPSFIVNRLLGRFMGEVAKVVDEGTPIEVADRAFAAGAHAAVHPARAGRPGDRAAQQRDAGQGLPPTGSTSRRTCVASSRPGGDLHLAGGQARRRPGGRGALREARRPGGPDRTAGPRARPVGPRRRGPPHARRGCGQAPMDIDLAMITGAGFQFWNGGLTPLLDREGVSEKVTGHRFLPPGVASVPA